MDPDDARVVCACARCTGKRAQAYVAVRVSNSSRCKCTTKDNKWKMDRATGRWASFVAVCRMKNDLTDVEVTHVTGYARPGFPPRRASTVLELRHSSAL